MRNVHGTPIWYELLTEDHGSAKAFYDYVIQWNVHGKQDGPIDYRMIETADGSFVGGVMQLSDDMKTGGAKAGWLFYIGVDDVDTSAAKVKAEGGTILMEPFDIPGAGRAAFCTDPQGIPFYIMRGATDGESTAYDRMGMGKCNWNELTTTDQEDANRFYAAVFGWTYPDKMAMGDMGDYFFVQAGEQTIGATMRKPPEAPPANWRFYFRTPDINAAADRVKEKGGQVLMGPHEVPGGDMIFVASAPDGVLFGVVAPKQGDTA